MTRTDRVMVAILAFCYAGSCMAFGLALTGAIGATMGSTGATIPTPYLLAWWGISGVLTAAGYPLLLRGLALGDLAPEASR